MSLVMGDTATDYRGYRLEAVQAAPGEWHVNFCPVWLRLPAPAKPDIRHYISAEAALAAGRAQVDRLLAGLPDRRGWPAPQVQSKQS